MFTKSSSELIITDMKKLITLLTLVLVVFGLGAATVYVGGEAGLTFNSIIAGRGYNGYEYSKGTGFAVSVPVVVEFSHGLGLQTGASVAFKSYDYSKTITVQSQTGTMLQYRCDNCFLEIPVAFRYSLGFGNSGFGVFATVGGFAGYWVGGMRKGFAYGFMAEDTSNVEDDLDLDYYNRWQAGVSAGAGIDYEFGSCDVSLSFTYALALTDLNRSQKYASFPEHNSTLTVAAGILWGINK